MSRWTTASLTIVMSISLVACAGDQPPTGSSSSTAGESSSPTAAPSATTPASVVPTTSPAPSLALDLPSTVDSRVVAVQVDQRLEASSGAVVVTVTSLASERIDELVLRWPTALNDLLYLAPFTPSDERIRDGGDPLVQPWTKWVIGPGERGEPAGAISLGWGPLMPGATLIIELDAVRRVPGPIEFDLQVLSSNDLLSRDDGTPAELRVTVP